MCDCGQLNPCGCNNTITLPYLTGATGPGGLFGGYSAKWKFDANSVLSNPSVTYLRFNSTTYSSVATIYVSDTGYGTVSMDNYLDTLTSGYIYIFKEYDPTKFWYGEITANVDNGNYHTLTVTHIQSNSTFANDDSIVITYSQHGADGSNANTKAYTKESFIGNNTHYEQKLTTGIFATDLTTNADELATNGDELIADIILRTPATDDDTIRLVVGGVPLSAFKIYGSRVHIHVNFTRQSTTQLYYEGFVLDGLNYTTQYTKHFDGFVTVADVSANPFDVEVEIVSLNSASIDLYKMQSKYSLI